MEIQEKIIKKGERNHISRLVYAKVDKETIAGWKLDLNRILHVFNVCSVVFTWLSLTVPFQTELAINTHVAVSDVHHDVSEIRRDVSEILDGQSRSVSAIFYPPTIDAHFTRLLLTVPFQTELAVNTNVTVSDVQHNVSGIRRDVSEILDGQSRSVSVTCIHQPQMFTVPRLKLS